MQNAITASFWCTRTIRHRERAGNREQLAGSQRAGRPRFRKSQASKLLSRQGFVLGCFFSMLLRPHTPSTSGQALRTLELSGQAPGSSKPQHLRTTAAHPSGVNMRCLTLQRLRRYDETRRRFPLGNNHVPNVGYRVAYVIEEIR